MLEKLRKLGLYGIGLAVLTEEKIEALVKEAIDEGKITEKEGKSAVKELVKESKKEIDRQNQKVKKEVKKTLADLGVPTKKDISSLEARINKLENDILKELKEER